MIFSRRTFSWSFWIIINDTFIILVSILIEILIIILITWLSLKWQWLKWLFSLFVITLCRSNIVFHVFLFIRRISSKRHFFCNNLWLWLLSRSIVEIIRFRICEIIWVSCASIKRQIWFYFIGTLGWKRLNLISVSFQIAVFVCGICIKRGLYQMVIIFICMSFRHRNLMRNIVLLSSWP